MRIRREWFRIRRRARNLQRLRKRRKSRLRSRLKILRIKKIRLKQRLFKCL